MNIVLTGSIGNIGKPLAQELVEKGHTVTVISSNKERAEEIETIGAKAAIGKMQDVEFLVSVFTGADVVYLMETLEAAGDMFDTSVNFIGTIKQIGENYRKAVEQSSVKKIVHLSSIGAHMDQDNGILIFHHNAEQSLRQLAQDVAVKFIRPVGFYTNLFSFIHNIKTKGTITSNYGGDEKEPWVAPSDIAEVVSEEILTPFSGRTVRYVASDEVSPNEIAAALGQAIGKPGLTWNVIPDEQLLDTWLGIGFNPQIAHGFVEMQASQGNGKLYEDYYQHRPVLGKVKLKDFAQQFAAAYNKV